MLHDELIKYLSNIEIILHELKDAYFERYDEEILADDRINLRVRIRFLKGELLEINEAVIYKKKQLQHLNYRYHFQNEKNELVFRYDNTPHFPELDSFPHHKHLPDKVISNEQPSISKVIKEIKSIGKK